MDNEKRLDADSQEWREAYERSLSFLLIRAAKELYPERNLVVDHTFGQGLYCEFDGNPAFGREEVSLLKKRMKELVDKDEPFIQKEVSREEAVSLFEKRKQWDKVRRFQYVPLDKIEIHSFGGIEEAFIGNLLPSSGVLTVFDLSYYPPGFVLRFPDVSDMRMVAPLVERKRLFAILHEHERWAKVLGVRDSGQLNEIVEKEGSSELVMIAEALHEKKLAGIADAITSREPRPRLILIAGPSASGKTTFAKRLRIQLRVNGLRPLTISVDNYFVERDKTPKDEKGEYDFESVEAIDVGLLNEHLLSLLAGKRVSIPKFDFQIGSRTVESVSLMMEKDDVLMIEGIHALNEKLTFSIPLGMKYKIYVSALTQMNLDDHNRIATSDVRLLRRMVRDKQYRGYEAFETLSRWKSVRAGEEKNIFPYQENADVMFNSALIYELAVLKPYAEALLHKIQSGTNEYRETQRLLKILAYFLPINPFPVPLSSILREFIGGSGFKY